MAWYPDAVFPSLPLEKVDFLAVGCFLVFVLVLFSVKLEFALKVEALLVPLEYRDMRYV